MLCLSFTIIYDEKELSRTSSQEITVQKEILSFFFLLKGTDADTMVALDVDAACPSGNHLAFLYTSLVSTMCVVP